VVTSASVQLVRRWCSEGWRRRSPWRSQPLVPGPPLLTAARHFVRLGSNRLRRLGPLGWLGSGGSCIRRPAATPASHPAARLRVCVACIVASACRTGLPGIDVAMCSLRGVPSSRLVLCCGVLPRNMHRVGAECYVQAIRVRRGCSSAANAPAEACPQARDQVLARCHPGPAHGQRTTSRASSKYGHALLGRQPTVGIRAE
jgi:hypothetical protein